MLEAASFAPLLHIMRLPVATPKQVQVQFLLCKSATIIRLNNFVGSNPTPSHSNFRLRTSLFQLNKPNLGCCKWGLKTNEKRKADEICRQTN